MQNDYSLKLFRSPSEALPNVGLKQFFAPLLLGSAGHTSPR